MKNKKWFFFYKNLLGYSLYRKEEKVPKHIAFWSGFTSEYLIKGKGTIRARKM